MRHEEIEGGGRLRLALKISFVAWGVLAIIGPVWPPAHPHFDFERVPSFAAIFGVVAAVGLVQLAIQAAAWGLDPDVEAADDA